MVKPAAVRPAIINRTAKPKPKGSFYKKAERKKKILQIADQASEVIPTGYAHQDPDSDSDSPNELMRKPSAFNVGSDGRVHAVCTRCQGNYEDEGTDPLILSCRHTFCDRCLREIESDGTIECPRCQVSTLLLPKARPDRSAVLFPPSSGKDNLQNDNRTCDFWTTCAKMHFSP